MARPITVIALAAPAGAGKDTVADILATHAGFRKVAFADTLRSEVSEAYHEETILFTRRDFKDVPHAALALHRCFDRAFVGALLFHGLIQNSEAEMAAPRSPRQILQWWGTEYKRSGDPDYWVKATVGRIAYLINNRIDDQFVITDCRFANEVAELRRIWGAPLWRIERPGFVSTGLHASDVDGREFSPDCVILNNGSIPALRDKVLAQYCQLAWQVNAVKLEVVD